MIDKTKEMAPDTLAPQAVSAQSTTTMFNTVEDAVNAIAAGEMIIVVDDADRDVAPGPTRRAQQGVAGAARVVVLRGEGRAPLDRDGGCPEPRAQLVGVRRGLVGEERRSGEEDEEGGS